MIEDVDPEEREDVANNKWLPIVFYNTIYTTIQTLVERSVEQVDLVITEPIYYREDEPAGIRQYISLTAIPNSLV